MATVSAKCAISVQLSCRASLSWTQVDYSDQKLPYYHNVNKCSNLGSNAKNLIAVHRTSLKSLEICWKANQLRLCSLNAQSHRNKAAEFVCCAISFKNDLLYVSTVLIALMSWSTYTTQHCLTHLMHTLPLSPRPSDHGHLFHGTVWRLTKREERDGKQKLR